VLDRGSCQDRAPAALPPVKKSDLHCGPRHEYIITAREIVLTLTDFTLWRGLLQQMKMWLLEEELWLDVCVEFEIREYRSCRLICPCEMGEVTMVECFYDYGRCGTCYVCKLHPVISLVTEENQG